MRFGSRFFIPVFLLLASLSCIPSRAQDWVRIGSNLGNAKIRIAAADFKPVGEDPQTPSLKAEFDSTLYSDLGNAGIFDLVSKSFAPTVTPGSPQEINLSQWSAAPASAAMVAFGALSVANGRLVVYGWLDDASNTANPQVLGRQYNEAASQDMARTIAHRFADEIISRLGGMNGVAETKIYFISSRTGSKEVWVMDYDGANQHALTHLGSSCLSPHVSPDNSRVAFGSLGRDSWSIRMYSLDLGRLVAFPAGTVGSLNQSPAWSSDGSKIAFASANLLKPRWSLPRILVRMTLDIANAAAIFWLLSSNVLRELVVRGLDANAVGELYRLSATAAALARPVAGIVIAIIIAKAVWRIARLMGGHFGRSPARV